MPPGRGLSAAAVLGIALAASVPARAQPPVPASPPPSPSPAASVPVLPPRPVSESVDRVVQRMEEAREDPCKQARDEGRPCFPVITTQKGEEFSVRKSLGLPDQDKTKPTPGGAPTTAEMRPYRPGSHTPVGGVSFDPGCMAKSLLKSLKGRNDVYYLYRMRDVHGERVELFDHKVEASTFQGEIAFLGRFDGECAALGAMRHEELFHPSARPSASPPPP